MIKTICYISDALKHYSLNELKALYTKAKANNRKFNITGILVYKNQNFMQVLEGEKKAVNETYNRIKQDSRHRNIFKIIDTSVEQRIFEDYNFGFTAIYNKNSMDNLHDYLEWLRNADDKSINQMVALVENFIVRK